MSSINNPASANEEPDSTIREEKALNAEIDIVSESQVSNKFSEDDLHIHWEKYIDKLKSKEPRMYNVLSSQKPRLIDELRIEVVFLNNAQLIDFKQKIKISLLASLKESLKNYSLEIIELIQGEEYQPNTKHYTDTDKLKHMIEKNPSLQKLRQEFNLDFE